MAAALALSLYSSNEPSHHHWYYYYHCYWEVTTRTSVDGGFSGSDRHVGRVGYKGRSLHNRLHSPIQLNSQLQQTFNTLNVDLMYEIIYTKNACSVCKVVQAKAIKQYQPPPLMAI